MHFHVRAFFRCADVPSDGGQGLSCVSIISHQTRIRSPEVITSVAAESSCKTPLIMPYTLHLDHPSIIYEIYSSQPDASSSARPVSEDVSHVDFKYISWAPGLVASVDSIVIPLIHRVRSNHHKP